jgi:hypothetical protein
MTGAGADTPLPSGSAESVETRSNLRIVHCAIDVKSWTRQAPTVEAARPARCPCCGAAGRPEGRALGVVGHGLRERLMLGPRAAGDASAVRTLTARRYRCKRCATVLLVVPRGIVRRHLYTLHAIVLALVMWALDGKPAKLVREVISPFRVVGATAAVGWASVTRWARDSYRIFAGAPPPRESTRREQAALLVAHVAAFAPRTTGSLRVDSLLGAERAATWSWPP